MLLPFSACWTHKCQTCWSLGIWGSQTFRDFLEPKLSIPCLARHVIDTALENGPTITGCCMPLHSWEHGVKPSNCEQKKTKKWNIHIKISTLTCSDRSGYQHSLKSSRVRPHTISYKKTDFPIGLGRFLGSAKCFYIYILLCLSIWKNMKTCFTVKTCMSIQCKRFVSTKVLRHLFLT